MHIVLIPVINSHMSIVLVLHFFIGGGSTKMAVSSSFKFVNTSNPESLHSPLSEVYILESRRLPCTLVAESFRNCTVFCNTR